MPSRMDNWIAKHRRDPEVREWLDDNPPPTDWEGSELAWAWNSMPQRHAVGYMVGALAGLALVWLASRRSG